MKIFLNAFAGFNLKFLKNKRQKLKGLQNQKVETVKERNTTICDKSTNTALFPVPSLIEKDASYSYWDTAIKACDLEPLVAVGLAEETTISEFNKMMLDPYAAQYIFTNNMRTHNEQAWEKMKDYAFGHLALSSPEFAIARMPGTSRVQTMNGYIGQIALIITDGGRTVNTNFSQNPLTTDTVLDEMKAMLARQGTRESAIAFPNSGYAYHMTHAAAQNYGDSLLALGVGTNLLQAQTIDGSTYRVDAYRQIPIIVHPEWDEVLIAEGKEPAMILLAPMQNVTLYAPDPSLAPAGLFPYVLTQEFNGTTIRDKKLEQLYEWFGGALVGGLADEFELSY
jgi:hypothetical protein